MSRVFLGAVLRRMAIQLHVLQVALPHRHRTSSRGRNKGKRKRGGLEDGSDLSLKGIFPTFRVRSDCYVIPFVSDLDSCKPPNRAIWTRLSRRVGLALHTVSAPLDRSYWARNETAQLLFHRHRVPLAPFLAQTVVCSAVQWSPLVHLHCTPPLDWWWIGTARC